MAVKNPQKSVETPVSANAQTQDIAPAPVDTSANGSAKKRGPKGPRTTAPFEWSRAMEEAFVHVMSSPKEEGKIRTAAWVAHTLNMHPAYKDSQVTPQLVTAHVNAWQETLKKNGRAVPSWLQLDVVKRQPLDLNFWDTVAGAAGAEGAGATK